MGEFRKIIKRVRKGKEGRRKKEGRQGGKEGGKGGKKERQDDGRRGYLVEVRVEEDELFRVVVVLQKHNTNGSIQIGEKT